MIIDKLEEFCLKILEVIGLKSLASWYRKHQEGMRYLIFGALSTVINILVFAICSKVIHLETIRSNIIAWIVAVLFAYVTNKWWVFKSKVSNKKELFKEIMSFFSARVFTLIVETAFLWVVIDKLNWSEIPMKIISNILVIILNFILSKIFIFKDKHQENSIKEN